MSLARRLAVLIACVATALAGTLTGAATPAGAVSVCPTAESFPSGAGSAGDPYVIATAGNLQYLRETPAIWDDNLYFSFASDIDMTGCEWSGGLGQTSLNPSGFRASIDGQGHVVRGIAIVSTEGTVGFIAQHGNGSIEDLGVQGAITVNTTTTGSASSNVGGLIGASYSAGTIRRSFADVDISVTVSVSQGCNEFECRSSVQAFYGGLLGYSSSTSVSDSYALGDVIASASAVSGDRSSGFVMLNVGGLLGAIYNPVYRSYSTGSVAGSATAPTSLPRIGGFIGYSSQSAPNSFWDTASSGTSTGVGLAPGSPSPLPTGKVTADMKSISTYSASWSISSAYDAAKTWLICPSVNGGYPALMGMQSAGTCVPPELISISPDSGAVSGGTSITLTGTALTGATSVTIGGSPATITGNTATSINVTTPAGTAGAKDVVVTTANGSDTLPGAFTYVPPSSPAGTGGSSGGGGSSGAGVSPAIAPSATAVDLSTNSAASGTGTSNETVSVGNATSTQTMATVNRARVHFPYRSHELTAGVKAALDALVAQAPSASIAKVRPSPAGRGKAHHRLALARAQAVVDYLRQRGIRATLGASIPATLKSSSARGVVVTLR